MEIVGQGKACLVLDSAETYDRSSTLYLITFLVTIAVLATIASLLLFRAYRIRRRFRLRVQEAIQAGRPLPPDAAYALGIHPQRNTKKSKKHGPMPSLWESELHRDGDKWDELEKEGDWDEITVSRPGIRAYPPLPRGLVAWTCCDHSY